MQSDAAGTPFQRSVRTRERMCLDRDQEVQAGILEHLLGPEFVHLG
jgi:hypothetical protein